MAGNEDRLRRGYAALSRGDIDAYLDLLDPQVEWHEEVMEIGGGGVWHGHAGFRRWLEERVEAVGLVNFEVDELVVEGDWTFSGVRVKGSGLSSGVPFEQFVAHAVRWRDGRAVFVGAYPDMRQAREAAG